ncbi:DUF805 domain-containing protein [Shimia thalassica]|uniref:DUF805 domain-containing protein n=1 Tax=Shimia thalassica TaxID=1715693 RepID=UPI000C0863D0|nr:DUF805 domain-containing protein [Shimia thalassica]PHO04374.1 hypothetical protein CSC82_06830 [Rhodobacteraceae bacterium 4F10]MBU2943680.1 DUF805 domain-containing protein [Shimia thalassica]MDO6478506.1 DUF805 domain-containing protein [Shimia thalassica]MDO6501751.1 DUF805 domain-containing protein [Shimia thalassica]MDO6797952.1 DUF805 domain-containing protein [Shimia thalassica]
MSPYKSIITCFFVKYAVFRGKASRAEASWFNLLVFVLGVSSFAYTAIVNGYVNSLPVWIFFIFLMPHLSSLARRLHDLNRSGIFCVIPTILTTLPYLTFLVLMLVLNNPYFTEECCRVPGFAEIQLLIGKLYPLTAAVGIALIAVICLWPSQARNNNPNEVFS